MGRAPADVQLLVARCWAAEPSLRPQMSRVVQSLSSVVAQHGGDETKF